MKKKLSIIGTVGLPARYGGFEMFTQQITGKLKNRYRITVYCSSKEYPECSSEFNGITLKYIPLRANGIQSIFYDTISILHSLRSSDILLILGVSGCIILPFVKVLTSKKIVTNIDGLEWKRAKWNRIARWFLKLSEKMAVKYSHAVVSDNRVIEEYVLKEYGLKSFLIEYGGDHIQTLNHKKITDYYNRIPEKYAFSVCRIEPENNIHIILESFAAVPEIPLVIVGNWSISQYSAELKYKYRNYKNIYMMDPVYDQEKLNILRSNSYVYVHGHSAGGTNPSLVEAMCHGLPVIAYSVNFNRETTEEMALYFSDAGELIDIITGLESYPLEDIAYNMKSISEKRYSWNIIADKYEVMFKKILT